MSPGGRTARGEVRRNQLITTYGVGSVVAVEDEAFMVAGIDRWQVDGPNMHEPRLERELRRSVRDYDGSHARTFCLQPYTFGPEPRPVGVWCQDALVMAERGLERLYREDGARLWRALVAFSGDREVSSDAVAEAFAQALGRGDNLRDPQRWVWRAAFRIAAGELKDRRRFQARAFDAGYEMEEPPARLVVGLARLSPNQRAALVLHYYAGYPTKEIAGILGSSAATVRVHLSQGRKRLRRILEEHND